MAKRGLTISTGPTDHRAGKDPADPNPAWAEIYASLKAEIGEWPAFNWFGPCRLVSCDSERIVLQHIGAFRADECLKQHGYELCKAAMTNSAEVHYSGGFRDDPALTPYRPGPATYTMPPVKVYDRDFVSRAMADTRPPGPAKKFAYDPPIPPQPKAPSADDMRPLRLQNKIMGEAIRDMEAGNTPTKKPSLPPPAAAGDPF